MIKKIIKYHYPEIKSIIFKISNKKINYDNNFWRWYIFFNESEQWPLNKIKEYQFLQLKKTLLEIYRTSEYYSNKWGNIKSIKSIDDFTNLIPTIDRNEYKINYYKILSKEINFKILSKSRTSGTTGNALQFYHTKEDNEREWAAICHQWKRVGYDPVYSLRAEFRGLNPSGNVITYYPKSNKIRCSILHLKPRYIKKYAEVIKKYNIEYYHGYPSAIYLLAKEIISNKINFPKPKAILLASEQVFDWQIKTIEEAFFNSKIFSHYGCAERTVLGAWCEKEKWYHMLPQYSIVEIDSNTGEIIGTNLFNTVNGFIRYKMTDSVLEYDNTYCKKCKRPYYPVIKKLAGRSEDYLYSVEKGKIPPAIVTYPLKNLKIINEIQFIQNNEDRIIVRYNTLQNFDRNELSLEIENIKIGLKKIFGEKTNFIFERCKILNRNSSGKFKWIVSNIK